MGEPLLTCGDPYYSGGDIILIATGQAGQLVHWRLYGSTLAAATSLLDGRLPVFHFSEASMSIPVIRLNDSADDLGVFLDLIHTVSSRLAPSTSPNLLNSLLHLAAKYNALHVRKLAVSCLTDVWCKQPRPSDEVSSPASTALAHASASRSGSGRHAHDHDPTAALQVARWHAIPALVPYARYALSARLGAAHFRLRDVPNWALLGKDDVAAILAGRTRLLALIVDEQQFLWERGALARAGCMSERCAHAHADVRMRATECMVRHGVDDPLRHAHAIYGLGWAGSPVQELCATCRLGSQIWARGFCEKLWKLVPRFFHVDLEGAGGDY